MQKQGNASAILRFLRTMILIDLGLVMIVSIIGLLLGWGTLEPYGSAMIWIGIGVIVLAGLTAIGGLSSRAEDIGAFSITGAGNMTEHITRTSEDRLNNFGCFFVLLAAGLGLLVTGYMLQVVAILIG